MGSRFLVSLPLELRVEERFQHPPSISVTWNDSILWRVTERIIDLLSNGDKDLTAKKSDSLVLLLGFCFIQTKPHFLELTIHFLPTRGLFKNLNSLADFLWNV
jgi:hypothetical protein